MTLARALWAVGLVAAGAIVAGWLQTQSTAPAELCDALGRANVIRLATGPEGAPRCEGVQRREVALGQPAALLDGDSAELQALLDTVRAGALLLPTPALSFGRSPRATERVQALYLGPHWEVVSPLPPLSLRDAEQRVLARVARGLLGGAREPRLNAFPASLRRVQRVEVMVLLRKGAVHRLWRSARGRSIAQALLTASRVARERWAERQAAMGGPLEQALSELTVEVLLLREDGTLGASERRFIDSRVPEGYGLGLDYRNGWHYVLPRAIERHAGSATDALLKLLEDQGMSARALSERGSRLYRFLPVPLGFSPPSDARALGASDEEQSGTGASADAGPSGADYRNVKGAPP